MPHEVLDLVALDAPASASPSSNFARMYRVMSGWSIAPSGRRPKVGRRWRRQTPSYWLNVSADMRPRVSPYAPRTSFAADCQGDHAGHGAGGLQARELGVEHGRRRGAVRGQQGEPELRAHRGEVAALALGEVVAAVARDEAGTAEPVPARVGVDAMESPSATYSCGAPPAGRHVACVTW